MTEQEHKLLDELLELSEKIASARVSRDLPLVSYYQVKYEETNTRLQELRKRLGSS